MELIKWDDRRSYIEQLSRKDKVRFALFCAKQAIHLTKAPEAKECIRVIELWLDGKASADDCERAANAATYAANTANTATHATHAAHAAANAAHAAHAATAAAYATYAATNTANTANTATYAVRATAYANAATAATAYAAAYATAAATAADIKQTQMRYLYELINIDSIVEQTLLGGEICTS